MRAIDTNLLVRYFTNDETQQVAIVGRLFEECQQDQEPIFVSIPVVCELTWVLSFRFGYARTQIADALQELLEQSAFCIENASLMSQALGSFRNGPAGLADYLIGEIAAAAGCRDIVTFDKRLKGTPGFPILG